MRCPTPYSRATAGVPVLLSKFRARQEHPALAPGDSDESKLHLAPVDCKAEGALVVSRCLVDVADWYLGHSAGESRCLCLLWSSEAIGEVRCKPFEQVRHGHAERVNCGASSDNTSSEKDRSVCANFTAVEIASARDTEAEPDHPRNVQWIANPAARGGDAELSVECHPQ